MSQISTVNRKKASLPRLAAAASNVLEPMEKRVMMSTTVAAWNFDSLAIGTNLSPAASSGTGTALTVGLQTSSSNSNSPGGVYAYPNPSASGTGDSSDILNGTGNETGGNDNSSTGMTTGTNATGTNPAWRIRGSSDGWSDSAAVASQGAQFLASTSGDSTISLSFDIDASSTSAPAEVAVQYTTNGGTSWTEAPTLVAGTVSNNGASDGMSVMTNSTNPNIVQGEYLQFAAPNSTNDSLFWQNGVTASFPTSADNNTGFGVRIVNAATGTAEFEVGGTAYPVAGAGNWRLDNIKITASGGVLVAPSVTTNPTNQSVPAGQPVTFTAAATGNPAPSVQWYQGTYPTGTAISGATSPTYTFTTSITASDNNTSYYAVFTNSQGSANTTSATLNDTLAAPVIITQPVSVSTTAGNTATFTAAATGSPVPTVQWQSEAPGATSFTNIAGATSTTYSVTATTAISGTKYQAIFTNSQGSQATNVVTLTATGTTITAWNFSNPSLTTGATVLSVPSSVGTGTATSVGMSTPGVYTLQVGTATGGTYTLSVNDSTGTYTTSGLAYNATASTVQSALDGLNSTTAGFVVSGTAPLFAVTLTGDSSAVLTGSGSSLTGSNASSLFFVGLPANPYTGATGGPTGNPDNSNLVADTGSNGGSSVATTNIYRIVGNNGWNSSTGIGTQGAQFLTSTTGYQSLGVQFDLYATTQGEGNFQVEYTTDGSTWTNVPATDLSVGTDTGISVIDNSGGSHTHSVIGGYFHITAGQGWYNQLQANLSGITAINNAGVFGIRIVNASTGTDDVNTSGAALNNTSGNWRLDNVAISGSQIPVAPAIVTQPTPQTVTFGNPVTFTAAASGFPVPTVQWYSGTPSNPTLITGANSSSYTFTPTSAQNGTTYFAIFTNSLGSATTNVVSLTVNSAPTITLQPATQSVSAGATATFTAAATGYPTPTVQWQSSTNGVSFSNIAGATATTYSVTASSTDAGLYYRAVFTNVTGSATTNAVQLNVIGAAFSQWIFNGVVPETIENGLSDSSLISGAAGSGDAPLPTLTNNPYNSSTGTGDIAQTLGLFNDYTGVPVSSGADILHDQSTVNPSFDPYGWRIRSNHTETGWSQLAPQETTASDPTYGTLDPQGVLFRVNTTGYTDITLHFDWSGGGIADMQPQYSPDGGTTWINAGGILQNFSKDYPGITATTTPPGYTVSLEGSAYPAAGQPNSPFNNPNFQLRLVAAYDPNLPLISDGNLYDPTVHGQYADSSAGAQNAVQVLDIGGSSADAGNQFNVSGGTYQLSFGGMVTAPIAYNATPAVVQADLDALSTIGGVGGSVTVADYLITPNTTASANDDFLGITFGGSLGDQIVSTIGVVNNNLTGDSPTATVQTWVPGAAAAGIGANGYEVGVTRFQDSNAQTGANGGSWELADFSFNGLAVSGSPTIVNQPVNTTVIGGTTATFTASVYTEATPVSAQWQINTGSGWSNIAGATNFSGSTSTYGFTTNVNLSDSGHQFRVVFTNPNGSTISFPATLTVVAPVAPAVTSQPAPDAVQVGNLAQFTATATGSPSPTVQWQVNSGSGWTNLTNNGVSITGATTTTLSIVTNTNQVGSSYQYRAVFTNVVSSVASNPATLTVLAAETTFTDWNFATHSISYDNSPAPAIGTGTASGIGMTIPFDYAGQADGASGTGSPGAVNADDVTSTSGAANPAYTENTWRIRGGSSPTAGGAPYNGWSNYAKEYTQGAQFSTSTVGYNSIYVTMDVYTTTSGELNARQQYTLDGVNWYNLDDQQLAYNGSTNPSTGLDDLDPTDPYAPLNLFSNDFYGATATYDTTTISSVSRTNNVVTAIDNNDYVVGEQVNVKGIASPNGSLNGIFTITAATSTGFSYALAGANIAATTQTAAAANLGGYIVPLVFNLTGIAGVANNPNFGIRLVNAYNPSLPLISSTLIGDTGPTTHGQYAVASSIGNPTPYPGSAGNWRFDNIVFHGVATAPAWLSPGTSTYSWSSAAETLTITNGTATIIGDPAASGDSPLINVSGTSNLVIDSTTTNTVHIGGLNLSGGATASITAGTTDVLIVASGGTFSIAPGSTLNLTNNFLDLVNSGSAGLSAIDNLLASGYNNGAWSGTGIISSTAANDGTHLTTIGAGIALTSTFDGITPGASDVLVRYTYYGDANLNGSVDGSDYSLEDSAALNGLSGATGWTDLNYDGVINGSDYTLLDNAYNSQGPQITPAAQIAPRVQSIFAGVPISSVDSISDLLKKGKANLFAGGEDVVDALEVSAI